MSCTLLRIRLLISPFQYVPISSFNSDLEDIENQSYAAENFEEVLQDVIEPLSKLKVNEGIYLL